MEILTSTETIVIICRFNCAKKMHKKMLFLKNKEMQRSERVTRKSLLR